MKYTLATTFVSGLIYWYQASRRDAKEPDPEIGRQEESTDTEGDEDAWMAVALENLFGSSGTPPSDDGADQKEKKVVISCYHLHRRSLVLRKTQPTNVFAHINVDADAFLTKS